jgi:hypothetical protein
MEDSHMNLIVNGIKKTLGIALILSSIFLLNCNGKVFQGLFQDNSGNNLLYVALLYKPNVLQSITSTTPDGTYGLTDPPINVTLTFTEPVTLTGGSIDVTLDTGDVVSFSTINNSTSVSGTYTVGAGDNSSRLFATAVAINGGTLQDADGKEVRVKLPATSLNFPGAIVIDTTAPAGYAVSFDQPYVNNYNKTTISFTFTGAELGATYNYTITDDLSGSVSDSGTIVTANDTITPIDVDSLADTPLSLTVTLTDAVGNVGSNATDSIVKDETPPSNTGFPGNVSTGASQPVTIGSSGDTTNTVWFAPVGTTSFTEGPTMTKASGIATSILSPSEERNDYRLYVVDQFGNISTPSAGILTVDATAPDNQNCVFGSVDRTVGKSASVSISASSPTCSGAGSDVVWLAPAGTTTFTAGPTMTSATGSATSITSPASGGSYKLYVLDSAGNASPASTYTLTVDATAPTNQDDVFYAPATVGSAKPVTIAASSDTGGDSTDTVWLAPLGTTSFVANGTTITTAGGNATSITSPSTGGTYRLYVLDQYGNVSQASAAILTVDATAPANTVFNTNHCCPIG